MVHAHVLTSRLLAVLAGAGAVSLACGGTTTGDGSTTVSQTGSGGSTTQEETPASLPTSQCSGSAEEVCYARPQLESMVRTGGGQIPVSPTPTPEEIAAAFLPDGCLPKEKTYNGCCNQASAGPVKRGETCCYVHCTGACCGRPLLVGGEARIARAAERADWTYPSPPSDGAPVLPSPELVDAIARAWLEDALLEHASVASFARFSLDLLSFGAPPDLVDAAHAAARDEIEHARLCFGLARRFGARAAGPGPLPLGGVRPADSLESAVVSAIREGCVGETVAALVAREQLDRAADPLVRHALARVAEDEARHAELAFRFVAWALRADAALAAVVRRTFDAELARSTLSGPSMREEDRAAWAAAGRLTGDELAVVERRAKDEVVAAARDALVTAPAPIAAVHSA